MDTTDLNSQLTQQAAKIASGSYGKELQKSAKSIVNGGLIFGGIGIAYAMLSRKNTLLFGIGGFVTGLIMTSFYNRITKVK